ncbi:MAG: hypothetical protein R2836_05925 [Chitinophagales bacterium]
MPWSSAMVLYRLGIYNSPISVAPYCTKYIALSAFTIVKHKID